MGREDLLLHLRPAHGTDCPRLAEIDHRLARPWGRGEFERVRARARIGLALAVGEIVGYVVWTLAGERIRIHRLAVDVAVRRRGIGSRLVATLWETGCRAQVTVVDERDSELQVFLAARGFRSTNVIRPAWLSQLANRRGPAPLADRYVMQRGRPRPVVEEAA